MLANERTWRAFVLRMRVLMQFEITGSAGVLARTVLRLLVFIAGEGARAPSNSNCNYQPSANY